jgi:hypothetical protein
VSGPRDAYEEPRRLTVGDGLRFGFGFAIGLAVFWVVLGLLVLLAGLILRALL